MTPRSTSMLRHMIFRWLNDNLLTLNIEKTKYLTFSIKHYRHMPSDRFSILAHYCSISSQSLALPCSCPKLQKSFHIEYLGKVIDDRLGFQNHIDALTTRVRKLIFIFKTLRLLAGPEILKSVYMSVDSYCISSWGGAPTPFF